MVVSPGWAGSSDEFSPAIRAYMLHRFGAIRTECALVRANKRTPVLR